MVVVMESLLENISLINVGSLLMCDIKLVWSIDNPLLMTQRDPVVSPSPSSPFDQAYIRLCNHQTLSTTSMRGSNSKHVHSRDSSALLGTLGAHCMTSNEMPALVCTSLRLPRGYIPTYLLFGTRLKSLGNLKLPGKNGQHNLLGHHC
jgi:hypothetical protein